jgi:hypothetical protein
MGFLNYSNSADRQSRRGLLQHRYARPPLPWRRAWRIHNARRYGIDANWGAIERKTAHQH